MLVLTRKLGENIRIGDEVKITVLEVRSGQAKLGIEAPPDVRIHRGEVYAQLMGDPREVIRRKEPANIATHLVLSRKLGENIRIDDRIKITVIEVRSGQVKLGIEAPPEIKVYREEIYKRIQAENRKSGTGK